MATRLRYLVIFILLALFCDPAFAQPSPSEARDKAYELAVRHDYDAAIELLKPGAEDGDVLSGFLLGLVYEERGQEGDFARATKWYRSGAESEHGESQRMLADMLRWGKGVDQNRQEAAKWYRKAIENARGVANNAQRRVAQRGLAILIAEGDQSGTEKLPEAVSLLRAAAAAGDVASFRWLEGMILIDSGPDANKFDSRFEEPLCYLSSYYTKLMIEHPPVIPKGAHFMVEMRAPIGCKLSWVWGDNSDLLWMNENIQPWIDSQRRHIIKTGHAKLPKKLDVKVVGGGSYCPMAKSSETKWRLRQNGPDLTISNAKEFNLHGAIVGNQIVVVIGINEDDEYAVPKASILVVYGEWKDGRATLTNSVQNCTITLSSPDG